MEENTGQPRKLKRNEVEVKTNGENKNIEEQILTEAIAAIDKDIFFSSATANKKTAGVIKKRVEVLMINVYEKINIAINKGLYYVETELNKEQRNFLEAKGFRINLKSGGTNGVYNCVINW